MLRTRFSLASPAPVGDVRSTACSTAYSIACSLVCASTLLCFGSGVAAAQDNTATDPLQVLTKSSVRGVQSVVTVNPATKIATVQLYNPKSDTAVVELGMRFSKPSEQPVDGAALLAEDSVQMEADRRAQAATDSLEKFWSLAPWITERALLPRMTWLAPHQTATYTFHLNVPANAPPGQYSAYLVISSVQVFDMSQMLKSPLASGLSGVGVTVRDDQMQGAVRMFIPLPDHVVPAPSVRIEYTVPTVPSVTQ